MARKQDAALLNPTNADTPFIRDSQYIKGVILVLLAGVFWSTTGLFVRLMEAATEWQILFYRSAALVLALLILIGIRSGGAIVTSILKAGLTGLLAGLFLSASFSSFIFAITHTSVASAMFLISSAPFIAAILARIILSERVSRGTWVAMLGSSVGVAIMVGEGMALGQLFGNLMALLSAFGFAAYSVALRRAKNVDMLPAIFHAGMFTVIISGIMAMSTGQGLNVTLHDGLICTMLGAVQIGLGLTIYTAGSRYVPAAELVLLSLTEVVLSPVWVWLWIGEVPGPLTLLGGGIVLAAIAGQGLLSVRKRQPLVV